MSDHTGAADATIPLAAGVVVAGIVGVSALVACLAGAALLLAVVVRRPRRERVLALAAGAALAAVGLAVAELPLPADHVAHRASRTRTIIEGRIETSEVRGIRRRVIVDAERVRRGASWVAVSGLVAVTIARPERPWPPGARVRLRTRLKRPRNFGNPGDYDHVGGLARRRIFATAFVWDDSALEQIDLPGYGARGVSHWVRERVRARLMIARDPGASAFLRTVLLGEREALSPSQRRQLARAGVAHVAAVSGFHVAVAAGAGALLIGGIARRRVWLLRRRDVRKVAALGGVPLAFGYCAIAGGQVPATRALLMYVVACLALWIDRRGDAIRALAAVACCVLIPGPTRVTEPSFALSFTSVLAIVLVIRRAAARASGGRARRWLRVLVVEPLRVTLAAWMATAPLMAHYFQEVSLVAPLANLLVLPLLGPGTLVPGLLALPLIPVAGGLADVLLACASRAAQLGLSAVAVLAELPWAAVATPRLSALELGLCYAAFGLYLGGTFTAAPSSRGRRVRALLALAVVLGAVGDIGYWVVERSLGAGLRVTFLSVGQGDAAVVELPRGRVMVVDGGGLPGPFDPGARVVGPFLRARKIRRLDVIALSHPQHDHYEGLAYLAEEFRVREFWSTGARSHAASFVRLDAALTRVGARRVRLRAGDVPLATGDIRVDVLHPPPRASRLRTNDASLVLRLAHGDVSILFAGDIEARGETVLVARGMPTSTVLKVPHHGSATSSSAGFLRAVGPRIAVVSAGHENRFGFPAPAVLERLGEQGAQVWRTDRDGAVRVESDGRHVVARGWRR